MSESSRPIRPEFLLEHAAWVRRLAGELVAEAATADDLAQQTLLTALERPPSRGDHPRAWLATVARSIAGRFKRSSERRLRHESSLPPPRGDAAALEVVARANLQRVVVEAVLALDEPYRATILMRYFEDLDPRAVAERLEVPLETVRTRLKRGLALLRARLEPKLGGERAWIAALLPFAQLPTASIAGVLVVTTTVKLGIAAVVLAIASVASWKWLAADAPDAGHSRSATSAAAEMVVPTPAVVAEQPAEEAPSAPTAERARVEPTPDAPAAAVPQVVPAKRPILLRGHVRDVAGAPVPETLVFLGDARTGSWGFHDAASFGWAVCTAFRNAIPCDDPPRQLTDADGAFEFSLQRHGKWNVGAIHRSVGYAWKLDVRVKESGEPVVVDLVLDPGVVITGIVTDDQGVGLRDARVRIDAITSRSHGGFGSQSHSFATTDELGRYSTFPLPLREFLVGANQRGYLDPQRIEVLVPAGVREVRQDFRLQKGRVLHGRLFDSSGATARLAAAPLPDFSIRAWRSDPREWQSGRRNEVGGNADVDREHDEYTLPQEQPGMTFVAAFSGNTLLGSAAAPAIGDELDLLLDLSRLSQPSSSEPVDPKTVGTFVLVVTDAVTHAPIGDYNVTFREAARGSIWGRQAQDDAGVYRSPELAVDRIDVTVSAEGYAPAVLVLETSADREPAPHPVALQRGDGSIRGCIRGAGGEPLMDAHVFLLGDGGEPALPQPGTIAMFSGARACDDWTEDDGRYEFSGLPPGDYLLLAEASGFAPATIRVTTSAGTATADLQLARGVQVVITPSVMSGDPPGRYALRIRDERGALVVDDFRAEHVNWRQTANASLRFELLPGHYSLEGRAERGLLARTEFKAEPGLVVSLEFVPAAK